MPWRVLVRRRSHHPRSYHTRDTHHHRQWPGYSAICCQTSLYSLLLHQTTRSGTRSSAHSRHPYFPSLHVQSAHRPRRPPNPLYHPVSYEEIIVIKYLLSQSVPSNSKNICKPSGFCDYFCTFVSKLQTDKQNGQEGLGRGWRHLRRG